MKIPFYAHYRQSLPRHGFPIWCALVAIFLLVAFRSFHWVYQQEQEAKALPAASTVKQWPVLVELPNGKQRVEF